MQHVGAQLAVAFVVVALALGCSNATTSDADAADVATDPVGTALPDDPPAPDTPALDAIGDATTIITPRGEYEVSGAILEKYDQVGGQAGPLGLPTADEEDAPNGGRFSTFEGGAIYWTSETGAHAVWGAIRDAWEREGGADGPLGYPTSDQQTIPGGWEADFQHGTISYVDGDARIQVPSR
ncbi:LGFP repeat-containing protein [Mycolicibacterium thermoresistibile]